MRKLYALTFICLLMASCVVMDEYAYSEIEFVNRTDSQIFTGYFFKSSVWPDKLGLTDNSDSLYHIIDADHGEFLYGIGAAPSFYSWKIAIGPFNSFEEAFGRLGTDTIFIPVASSRGNLTEWFRTRNSLYLLDLFALSVKDLGENANYYELVYKGTKVPATSAPK